MTASIVVLLVTADASHAMVSEPTSPSTIAATADGSGADASGPIMASAMPTGIVRGVVATADVTIVATTLLPTTLLPTTLLPSTLPAARLSLIGASPSPESGGPVIARTAQARTQALIVASEPPRAQDATGDGTLPFRILALSMAGLAALLGVLTYWYWKATMPPARRPYLPAPPVVRGAGPEAPGTSAEPRPVAGSPQQAPVSGPAPQQTSPSKPTSSVGPTLLPAPPSARPSPSPAGRDGEPDVGFRVEPTL